MQSKFKLTPPPVCQELGSLDSWKWCDQDHLPTVKCLPGDIPLPHGLPHPVGGFWNLVAIIMFTEFFAVQIVDPKMLSPSFIIRIKACVMFHCMFNFKCCLSFFSLDLWQRVALLCHQCGVSCGYLIHGWSNVWTIPGDQRLAHSSFSHSHATYGRRMLAR